MRPQNKIIQEYTHLVLDMIARHGAASQFDLRVCVKLALVQTMEIVSGKELGVSYSNCINKMRELSSTVSDEEYKTSQMSDLLSFAKLMRLEALQLTIAAAYTCMIQTPHTREAIVRYSELAADRERLAGAAEQQAAIHSANSIAVLKELISQAQSTYIEPRAEQELSEPIDPRPAAEGTIPNRVMKYLKDRRGQVIRLGNIVDALVAEEGIASDLKEKSIRAAVCRMAQSGIIDCPKRGWYMAK